MGCPGCIELFSSLISGLAALFYWVIFMTFQIIVAIIARLLSLVSRGSRS